jgi:hypothetical protein
MYCIYNGRIEMLPFQNGEPVFDPPPLIVWDVMLAHQGERRPLGNYEDYVLKRQVVRLCERLQRHKNGVVRILEVKDGLPFRVSIVEPLKYPILSGG